MARRQAVGGGDALQIWRVGVNILNRCRGQLTMSGPSIWELDVGPKLLTVNNHQVYEMLHRRRSWTDYFERPNQKMLPKYNKKSK
jgi:hypothetical protein